MYPHALIDTTRGFQISERSLIDPELAPIAIDDGLSSLQLNNGKPVSSLSYSYNKSNDN